jgi:hypothetical protein
MSTSGSGPVIQTKGRVAEDGTASTGRRGSQGVRPGPAGAEVETGMQTEERRTRIDACPAPPPPP